MVFELCEGFNHQFLLYTRMSESYEIIVMGDSSCKNDAVRSFLQMSLDHIAEFQVNMLEVIAGEFGLKMDDLVEAIRGSAVFQKKIVELRTKKGKRVIVRQAKAKKILSTGVEPVTVG